MDAPRFDRRNEMNIERYATFFFLALNIGGIVWAAATVSGSVNELRRVVEPLAIEVAASKNKIEVLMDRSNRGTK